MFNNTKITLFRRPFFNSNVAALNQSSFSQQRLSFWRGLSKSAQQARNTTWRNYNNYYNRSNWDRLKRPFLFTFGFCAATTVATPLLFNYTPLSIYKKNPQALIWTIIGLNGAVFLSWRVPQLQKFTMKYGILFKDNVQSPWTLLGSAFSHQSFAHFLVNMLCFQSFASTLVAVLGVSNFSILYLNSAVISSFACIAIPTILGSSLSVASLGASGAIFGVFGAFSVLFPTAPVGIFFVPIPGGSLVLFLGTVLWNAAGTVMKWGTFDYAAHLGGSLVGIAYGLWFARKRKEEVRKRRFFIDF
ncbi:uncharacterized protein LODBEIA_P32700 [Lodderomyces beijingensis]|uniref:Peptidase S54 rhomboid domain-containing protein n=1 Tax=Lodderomyces beijingensis TaxID=1775926 RepID=A0ABP0ZQ41_9ASCO